MLLSLISVLVLLVIGFYAFWLGIVGRVAANQGPELSIPGRAVVLGIGVLALGIAYTVYSRSDTSSFNEAASSLPAMSSNPPESRGSEPAAAPAETAAATEETPAPASDETSPDSEAPAETATADKTAAEPEPPLESESKGLSAAAARMEAEALRPRRSSMAAAEPVAEPAARESMREPVPATVVTVEKRAVSEAAPRSKNTRSTSARRGSRPLLLHVHNSLGRDQARKQLTLSIEGLAVADIEVDGSRPSVAVAVPLPRPGLLHYRLEGVSEDDGTTVLRGEGCIRVKDGARFAVRRQAGSRKVFLEQQSTRGRSAG